MENGRDNACDIYMLLLMVVHIRYDGIHADDDAMMKQKTRHCLSLDSSRLQMYISEFEYSSKKTAPLSTMSDAR